VQESPAKARHLKPISFIIAKAAGIANMKAIYFKNNVPVNNAVFGSGWTTGKKATLELIKNHYKLTLSYRDIRAVDKSAVGNVVLAGLILTLDNRFYQE
jgi:hypothetical protein